MVSSIKRNYIQQPPLIYIIKSKTSIERVLDRSRKYLVFERTPSTLINDGSSVNNVQSVGQRSVSFASFVVQFISKKFSWEKNNKKSPWRSWIPWIIKPNLTRTTFSTKLLLNFCSCWFSNPMKWHDMTGHQLRFLFYYLLLYFCLNFA